jgi:glycosyltransferase involved in cell wall biosynthesis
LHCSITFGTPADDILKSIGASCLESLKETVSVIVPTFNSERVIDSCLKSIVKQTYPDLEIIIVDGGSTDSTLNRVSAYPAKIIKTSFCSRTYQRNQGAIHAKGKWLLYLDSDEVLQSKLVETCVELASEKKLDSVLLLTIDTGATYFGKSRCIGDLINIRLGNDISVPNFVPRFFFKETFNQMGGYDESLVVGEDVILKFRWLNQGRKIMSCGYPIAHYATEGLTNIFLKKYDYGKTVRAFDAAAKEVGLAVGNVYVFTGIQYLHYLFKFRECGRFIFGFAMVKLVETLGLFAGYSISSRALIKGKPKSSTKRIPIKKPNLEELRALINKRNNPQEISS